jgi:hypothetical protein
MSSLVIQGDTSGSVTLSAPAVAGTVTVTLPSTSGVMAVGGGTITTLTTTSDITVNGLTVGRGGAGGAANTAYGASAIPIAPNSGVTAIGSNAGKLFNTASDTGQSTFVGYFAGASCVSGTDNTFIGGSAGTNTTGSKNTAVGSQALQLNTTASNNTAVGYQALYTNTSTGSENTAVGTQALYSNTDAYYNVAVGYRALYADTTGNQNVAVGYQAGVGITTASGVVAIGVTSATTLTTGLYGTYIGYQSTASAAGATSEIVVCAGGSATAKGSSTGFISPNNGAVYQGNNSAVWATTSDRRLKKNIVDNNIGLEKITAIQVRNFEYRLPEEVDAELKPTDAIKKSGVQLGVIAQELNEVLPECIKTESTGVMSVNSDNLTWYLVNAIKELKAEVDAYKATHP